MLGKKNDRNEQKPRVELPLPLSTQYLGLVKVKKEHLFKPQVKKEQLITPKVELEVGIPDSSTHGLQTAVAAEQRTARTVIKWNKPTNDHFVQFVKKDVV